MVVIGKEASLVVVLMLEDSLLRMKDTKGFCDNPTPPKKKEKNSLVRCKESCKNCDKGA